MPPGRSGEARYNARECKIESPPAFGNEIGLKYLTVYAFSTENWKRTKEEIGALMLLLQNYLDKFLNRESLRNIRIRVMGNINELDKGLKDSINRLVEKSKNNTGLTLNIAFNYGGRNEIVRATKQIATNKNSVYANCHSKKLLTLTSPPVLISKSGSGSPFVNKLLENISSFMSSILISSFLTIVAICLVALTISFLPP